jgi:hypothetical protein
MLLNRLHLLLITSLLVGCSDDPGSDASEELSTTSLPGVYTGMFPCDGCPGIMTTLWLRADSRFFLGQQYPADEAREAMDVYALGRWNLIEDGGAIEVRGAGPIRTFTRADRDTLLMRTNSDLEHRLSRGASESVFTATIRMVGTISLRGKNAVFTECLTGYVAPVSKAGDFERFRHQFRSAGRGSEPTFVELEGRFTWSADDLPESLTIERFITVKASGGC